MDECPGNMKLNDSGYYDFVKISLEQKYLGSLIEFLIFCPSHSTLLIVLVNNIKVLS